MSEEMLNLTTPFEFKGKRYQVARRDITVQALFSSWVKSEAALEVWRLKATAPTDFYAEQNKLFADKLHTKQFKWGTTTCHQAYWSDEGQRQILWLKMKRGETKGGAAIERETLDKIAEDTEKWNELLQIMWEQDEPDFFSRFKEELEKQKATETGSKDHSDSP